MAIPRKWSTFARLLKPGQVFYEKGYPGTYTVTKVEPAGKRNGNVWKVWVENSSRPIIFSDTDRVRLLADPPVVPREIREKGTE